MRENNCQCDLCKSVWGGGEYMKDIELYADGEEWKEVDGELPPSPYRNCDHSPV